MDPALEDGGLGRRAAESPSAAGMLSLVWLRGFSSLLELFSQEAEDAKEKHPCYHLSDPHTWTN